MLIAQLSDLHVGGSRHDETLLPTAIAEVNEGEIGRDHYAWSERRAASCGPPVREPGAGAADSTGLSLFGLPR